MRVLYIGKGSGSSGHRLAALRRLGHDVTLLDPESAIPANQVFLFWMWRLGSVGLAEYIRRRFIPLIPDGRYDLAWVDHGHVISAGFVRDLKQRVPIVLNYNNDDPFGGRDLRLWTQFLRAVPYYDLLAVVRRVNVAESYAAGARRVMHVLMSADEIAHAPKIVPPALYNRWHSKVLFAGTAFIERGPFMAELVERGVPLTIFGNRWDRLKEWPVLKPYWKGPGLVDGDDYSSAVASADVCLGLLSKGNRDMHTMRSMEIPALGSVLCAERTVEHSALYREGVEAVFWNDAKECSEACKALLADTPRRESVAAKGRERHLKNGWTNTRVVGDILRIATHPSPDLLESYHAALPVPITV